jgi:hypothetical protein
MSETIKTNERELAGKIAQWFNEHIQRNNLPFSSASNESGIKVGRKTYFGDIIIWKNRETSKAFSYLELKPPFGVAEDIERFRRKAVALGVEIAYTWDFQTLVAYKIEKNILLPLDTETHNVLTTIEDWKRGDVQADIKAYIHKICEELLSISEKGKFRKFTPEKHYFINLLRKTTNDLIPIFEKFIKQEHRKKINNDKINKYVCEQGITYPSDYEFYKLIASQRVYGLVTKIIFYLTIKRYFTDLPDLQNKNEDDISKTIDNAFTKAGEIDWQAVFIKSPIEELGVPEESFLYLQELFSHLKIYNFGALPEDVIGELFEEIIDPEKRHLLGQYFTREDLVDLIIATVVNDAEKHYADPTCGSGTFLIRLYSRLKYLSPKLKHEDILEKIWGIDIGQFPAELSAINLFRQNVSNFDNFPRVVNKDIFDIKKGGYFEFPPPNVGKNYVKINIPIPEFYGLVGNFPFIRQELIEKKIPGLKKKLAMLLAEEYFFTYPKLFELNGTKSVHIDELNDKPKEEQMKIIRQWIDKKQVKLKLSGQADIFTYIFIHTATLLAKHGSFAIITSNAWLDASYGSVLKEFFLDNFKIKMIVASYAEPWFEVVAENTIFTVLEKDDSKKSRDENIVHFVKLKKKLEELIPERDLQLESIKRWQRIDSIIRTIDSANYAAVTLTEDIKNYENDDLKIRLLKQAYLCQETISQGEMSRWGKYLRSPDVYFEILEKCKYKLVPFSKMAKTRFGTKTGINDFFYLTSIAVNKKDKTITCKNKRGWEGSIESVYLKDVIKDPSKFEKIIIDKAQDKKLIFICNKSKEELKKLGHLGALAYIQYGEKQINKNNIKFQNIPSVKSRKYWYGINKFIDDEIVYLAASNNRFLTFYNSNKYILDKRLYGIKSKNDNVLKLLNSFFSILHLEASGKEINNGNAKEFTVEEVENMLLPDIDISYDITSLSQRKIKPIFEEVREKDRIALDSEILEKIGLDPKVYLPRIYDGITQMVRERLDLPKMRKAQQRQKITISYDQVKDSVIKECIGATLKKFPESFYTIGMSGKEYDTLDFENYNTSGQSLRVHSFINQHEVIDESDQVIFTSNGSIKAEFAVLLAKPNIFMLKIPKEEKVVESIINNYNAYMMQLREQIELNANQKLHSWADAEKMTKEILEEYGIQCTSRDI